MTTVFCCALAEDGEVDAAPLAVVDAEGVVGEIVVGTMLEDKETAWRQEVRPRRWQDEVGQLRQLWQGVGRVGKDELER